MIVGIDTDVLVNWMMRGAPDHSRARRLIEREVQAGCLLGFTPQVIAEFLHVVTDSRRFKTPMTMPEATSIVRRLWSAPETERILPGPTIVERATELIDRLRLGRKRILDTLLACTFEAGRVTRIATFNRADFSAFAFLEVVDT